MSCLNSQSLKSLIITYQNSDIRINILLTVIILGAPIELKYLKDLRFEKGQFGYLLEISSV